MTLLPFDVRLPKAEYYEKGYLHYCWDTAEPRVPAVLGIRALGCRVLGFGVYGFWGFFFGGVLRITLKCILKLLKPNRNPFGFKRIL